MVGEKGNEASSLTFSKPRVTNITIKKARPMAWTLMWSGRKETKLRASPSQSQVLPTLKVGIKKPAYLAG